MPWEEIGHLRPTCSLDEADRGALSERDAAHRMHMRPEAVRPLLEQAFAHLLEGDPDLLVREWPCSPSEALFAENVRGAA